MGNFRFISPELAEQLCSMGKRVQLEKGTVVVRPGDKLEEFYLLESGTVNFYRIDKMARKQLLHTLNAAEACALSLVCSLFGEESFLQAEVKDDCVSWVIPKQVGLNLMQRPDMQRFIMEATIDGWKNSLTAFDDVAFASLSERLLSYLIHQSRIHDDRMIKKSHSEIADDLNVSRESVSRLLKTMEGNRVVQLHHGHLKVLV